MSCREAGIPTGLGSSDQVGVGGGIRRGLEARYKVRLGSGLCGEGRQAENRPQVSGLMTVNVGTLADEDTWKQDISRLLQANLNFFFFFFLTHLCGEVGEPGGHVYLQYRVLGPK